MKEQQWSKKEEKETLRNFICLLLSFKLITKHLCIPAKICNLCLPKDSLLVSSHTCVL